MKNLFITLFIINSSICFSQNSDYIITMVDDTVACEAFIKKNLKCTNGRETIKYKSKELKEYQINDTTYNAVNGYKKKWHVHAFHLLGNKKHQIMQYDFMEAQTSGPSLPRTKLLITNLDFEFQEELLLNETTATTLQKYFKGCHVFEEELKKFKSGTTKRRFPMSDFEHLVNVYSNSCE